jgi:hypothetical protein
MRHAVRLHDAAIVPPCPKCAKVPACSAQLIRLPILEQHQLLRPRLEPRIDQIARGLLALAQPLGQLKQVDAAQRVDGDGWLPVGLVVSVSTLEIGSCGSTRLNCKLG